jgi:hypothetical protein
MAPPQFHPMFCWGSGILCFARRPRVDLAKADFRHCRTRIFTRSLWCPTFTNARRISPGLRGWNAGAAVIRCGWKKE